MKKNLIIYGSICLFLINLTFIPLCDANENPVDSAYEHLEESMDRFHNTFDIYTDFCSGGKHFYPTGRMGCITCLDVWEDSTSDPHFGTSAIKIRFTPDSPESWSALYWQEPENNWGKVPKGGYDLRGATKLTFWARGEKGGERVEFFVGGIKGQRYPDSLPKISTGYVSLSNSWKEYTIPLTRNNLSHVIGGFGFATNAPNNDNGATFFLDNIQFDLSRNSLPRFINSFELLSLSSPDKELTNVAYVYDNALALLAFLARGTKEDLKRAKNLADAFVYVLNNDRHYTDGRLRNSYMSGDISDHITKKANVSGFWNFKEKRWVENEFDVSTHTGNMAWVMLALLNYYETTGEYQYLEAVKTMGEWIEMETMDDKGFGGYMGGYEGWEKTKTNSRPPKKLKYKATEHNIDLYPVFMRLYWKTGENKWKERASHAEKFVEAMWDEKKKHFWTGTKLDKSEEINKSNIPVDVQAWATLAMPLGQTYRAALQWAEENCQLKESGIEGFDFNNDRDGIWFEGTAQMALAYRFIGEKNKSDRFLSQLRKAQLKATNNNEKGIVAASHDGVSTGFEWKYFNRLHIGATAWFIFAQTGYNPYWGTFYKK